MRLTLLKKTAEHRIYKRRDGRYAVKDAHGKSVNGEEKARILAGEGLISLTQPAAPEVEETAEAEAPEAGEAAAEAAPEAEAQSETAEAETETAEAAEAAEEEPAGEESKEG